MDQAVTWWKFEAIGTYWQIGSWQEIAADTLARLQRAVTARIDMYDQTYSRFRTDSLVMDIAEAAGSYEFPSDAAQLFDFYQQLYDISDGAVTPLIGQTLSDAGYDASYSLQPQPQPLQPPASWRDVMKFRGSHLTTTRPVLLDFGAAGKGYLVDIIASLLEQHGVSRYCVDAGGDIVVHGVETGLRVGLEHPADPEQVIGTIELNDGAICGSAGNRRQWAHYTHILDPRSLQSPSHIAAVWCQADSALVADGLATALYFVSPTILRQHFAFEYCTVFSDGTAEYSIGFKHALFSAADKVAA